MVIARRIYQDSKYLTTCVLCGKVRIHGIQKIMYRRLAIQTIGVACIISALDAAADEPIERSWHCSSQGLERQIVLYRRAASTGDGEFACRTVYAKDGESKVLWQALNNPDYCEPKVLALVKKLQNSGFQCTVLDSAKQNDQIGLSSETAVDDTDVMVPATQIQDISGGTAGGGSTAAEFRSMLQKHYVDSYLDAMVAAMPPGFIVQEDGLSVSRGPSEHLHVAPPDNFVKTLPDGSYVLVNTLRFERGATSSYVNFGFQVNDNRFRFLGYATTRSVTDIRILDADPDKVVVSVAPVPVGACVAARRTRTIEWRGTVDDSHPTDPGLQIGDTAGGDCVSD